MHLEGAFFSWIPKAAYPVQSASARPHFKDRMNPQIVQHAARILVADDDAEGTEVLHVLLRRLGHEATAVANGSAAMDALRAANRDSRGFDLLLLDMMMPVMDGYQVLAALREDPELRRTPVIVISAVDDLSSIAHCVEMGAVDFLLKPFNHTLLRARITACLEQKHLRDSERQALRLLEAEQRRSRRLLLNILPEPIAQRLLAGDGMVLADDGKIQRSDVAGASVTDDGDDTSADGSLLGEYYEDVTILFADVCDFSELTATDPPTQVVGTLNRFFSLFDRLARKHGVERIKTISDTYVAAGGVPLRRPDHAQAIADLALDMQHEMARVQSSAGDRAQPFSLRIGIHSGPVVAGVIGTARFAYDLWGQTVNIASQMEEYGLPAAVQVSEATYARLRDRYRFEPRGTFYVPRAGEVETYLLTGRRGA